MPDSCAHEFNLSNKLLVCPSVFGTQIPRTTPPPATTFANTENPESLNISETSAISNGLRRSGLSLPYFNIESSNLIRG